MTTNIDHRPPMQRRTSDAVIKSSHGTASHRTPGIHGQRSTKSNLQPGEPGYELRADAVKFLDELMRGDCGDTEVDAEVAT